MSVSGRSDIEVEVGDALNRRNNKKQPLRVVLPYLFLLAMAGSPALAQTELPVPLWAFAYDTQPGPDEPRAVPVPPRPQQQGRLWPGEDADELNRPLTIEGSSATYSRLEIRDAHNVIDWFPEDTPQIPDVIKYGPATLRGQPDWACGSCHLPNGKGRPSNASPAGQPAAYLIQQLNDMRDGLRYSADPRKPNTPNMIRMAKAMTEQEIQEAAEYFAAIPWTPWMRVIETDVIPEMRLDVSNMYIPVESEVTEPLAGRIVETAEDFYQANYLRNPRSGWVVYVPVGSLERGENLVTTGAGKTVQCGLCHGPDLMGLGNVPGIAGRSPSAMMRSLYDMKMGTRNGPMAQLMQPAIANLTNDDMRDIVAYLASLTPPTAVETQ
jgi:cytochrome c553